MNTATQNPFIVNGSKEKKYLVVELHRLDLSIACPVSIWFATRKNGDDKTKNIKYVKKTVTSILGNLIYQAAKEKEYSMH